MKLIKGRLMTYLALTVVLTSFIVLLIMSLIYSQPKNEWEETYPQLRPEEVFINGQYSIDGGEWHDTIPGEMIHQSFTKAVIKGELSLQEYQDGYLTIFSQNIWYDMTTDGMILSNYTVQTDPDQRYSSPGCHLEEVQSILLGQDSSHIPVTLTLEYPYEMFSNADLSDVFRLYYSGPSGVYELMLRRVTLPVILCVLLCFFGLIAFPIAGSVLGGINMRYLAFSLLCFFAGIHLLVQTLYPFFPLWLHDPVMCMTVCESTGHLFGLCMLVFIKVVLVDPKHKIIGNIVLFWFSLQIIVLYVLHYFGRIDLYASNPFAQLLFIICTVVLSVCLIREININNDAKPAALTLLPLAVTLVYDTLNMYFGFTDFMLFEFGVAVALAFQLVTLVIDLRRQYKETIRYQQIQKELYESRVAIMVSQIQPHFLYNSLTSIAMMCSIDPDTAQEATITFADYLRGNMDSLKQKTPVPFSKELEHLKKYLYIEKLRFGDDLNIVYDIQTDNFTLPQLSIQPLVENAVKHGVGMKREGGTVTIATRETDKAFEVIVSDDGVGFDTEQTKNDGRSHIGMENVRRRLAEMCGGTVTITSVIGEGTTATVTLPKEGQNNENLML